MAQEEVDNGRLDILTTHLGSAASLILGFEQFDFPFSGTSLGKSLLDGGCQPSYVPWCDGLFQLPLEVCHRMLIFVEGLYLWLLSHFIFHPLSWAIFHPAVRFIGGLYLAVVGRGCCCRHSCRQAGRNSCSLVKESLRTNVSHLCAF